MNGACIAASVESLPLSNQWHDFSNRQGLHPAGIETVSPDYETLCRKKIKNPDFTL